MKAAVPSQGRRGTALVMTLIILTVITLMILGLADLVRHETVASGSHQERDRALLLAQMGTDLVQGVLRKETADPSLVWASMPGALLVPDASAAPADRTRLTSLVRLHSGMPSPDMLNADVELAVLRPASLNIQTFDDQRPPTHLITDQRTDPANPASPVVKLPLRWIYVRRNGTFDYAERPDLTQVESSANPDKSPIVGRFAFWTDDESSKINLNTAWKRNGMSGASGVPSRFSPSHPTAVSLAALEGMTPEMADRLHAAITPDHTYTDLDSASEGGRFFNSIREPRALGPDMARVLNAARFEVTHFSHDPDTTFFNEPRIVLTTQKKHARGRPFLDILTNPGSDTASGDDPGAIAHIDGVKLNRLLMGDATANPPVLGLLHYLQRTDWPIVDKDAGAGGAPSFQAKYFPDSPGVERLTQLALNIIEYVRSAESSMTFVEPIRGMVQDGAFIWDVDNPLIRGEDNTYKGLTRSLYITEVGAWVSERPMAEGPHRGRYKYRFFVEVHLPKNGGVPSLDFGGMEGKRWYIYLRHALMSTGDKPPEEAMTPGFFTEDMEGLLGSWLRIDPADVLGGRTELREGGYATLAFTLYCYADQRPTEMDFRTALMLAADEGRIALPDNARLELCPLGDPDRAKALSYPIDDPGVAETAIHSCQTDDPRVNLVADDFKLLPNTFGARNRNSTLGSGPAEVTPQQDTDASGQLTDAGQRMPYPTGHARNLAGVVLSSGELGHIHTGMEISSTTPGGGIPWRTLRLQPGNQGSGVVPDWALMDLFTVPVDVPRRAAGLFTPHDTATGGRININGQAQPFGNREATPMPLQRIKPLTALFMGIPKNDDGQLLTAEEAAVLADNVASHLLAAKGKTFGHPAFYDSPGEIVEIAGVADRGEESEAIVRGMANLVSTRGGVFSVFSVGQSLKQTRNGTLVVTGEQRQQTMLERYDADPDPAVTTIRFRKIFFRHLNP